MVVRELRLRELGYFAQIALIKRGEVILIERELPCGGQLQLIFLIGHEFRRLRFVGRATWRADFSSKDFALGETAERGFFLFGGRQLMLINELLVFFNGVKLPLCTRAPTAS